MDKNFSIQPREPLLEKQYPRPLGKNDKCLKKKEILPNQLFISPVVKGGCDNGWSEDQFERECQPVNNCHDIAILKYFT